MKAEILPSGMDFLKGRKYRILVLPDLHIPIDMDLKRVILQSDIIKSIDYVILLGDNIACYGNDKEYKFLNEFLKNLKKPYSVVNGNHEFMFEVQEYNSETYGKVWKPNNEVNRRKQLEKFYNFFDLKKKFWSEKVDDIIYIYLTIGREEEEKIEVLPEGCEKFLIENYRRNDGSHFFIFCHAPLKGSEIPGFKYYSDDGDPFVYLSKDTLSIIENSKTYWFSGHIHLSYSHPMSLIRKISKNLYQVNCPPSWKFSRKLFKDIVPKRYEEFTSLIIEKYKKKIKIKVFDWLRNEFIKSLEI